MERLADELLTCIKEDSKGLPFQWLRKERFEQASIIQLVSLFIYCAYNKLKKWPSRRLQVLPSYISDELARRCENGRQLTWSDKIALHRWLQCKNILDETTVTDFNLVWRIQEVCKQDNIELAEFVDKLWNSPRGKVPAERFVRGYIFWQIQMSEPSDRTCPQCSKVPLTGLKAIIMESGELVVGEFSLHMMKEDYLEGLYGDLQLDEILELLTDKYSLEIIQHLY